MTRIEAEYPILKTIVLVDIKIEEPKTSGFLLCGASIINKDTAITAAHCCSDLSPEDVMVVAGEHDLSEKSGDEQTVGVQKIIMYELYGTKRNSYDICLLKLESPLKLNDKVKTITLPEKDEEFTGEAIVSGWGVRSFGSSTSPVLRATNITLISFDECKDNVSVPLSCSEYYYGTIHQDRERDKRGGEVVEPHSIPFQISIQTIIGNHACGGSIKVKTLITAGHCWDSFYPWDVLVIAVKLFLQN
ncbi:unnamed protein product [Lepeophtheirus salmonis]|uniref:(salmon louse) hypothetical protein n=1 Tax=Lepeophtheirus salmonis TaxID=72036 RepID=A0A7R8GYN9_LEPSM|nr:unnamed protein product [Lepeophtheirus salmonis]CAF2750301.1 unnamed protein product [Lepeophtheirus salmonis]